MIKKINIKALGLLLVLLGALVVFMIFRDNKKGSSTFDPNIVQLDTTKVTSIFIYPKAAAGSSVELLKRGKKWDVKLDNGNTVAANNSQIRSSLDLLVRIKANRLAATSKDKWESLEVGAGATRVKVMGGEEILLDIIIGKFSYVDQRTMLSYVRLNDQVNVYAVDGFLGVSFNRVLSDWRDQTVLNIVQRNIIAFSIDHTQGDRFKVFYTSNQWMLDSIVIDSPKVFQYFNATIRINSNRFVDNIVDEIVNVAPKRVSFQMKDNTSVIVSAYFQGMINDTVPRYIITSSQNPGIYFDGAKDDLYNKLFVQRNSFFDTED